MSTYQPGIPTGRVKLLNDYQNVQGNFQQLDTQFGVDHIPFSNTSGTPPAGINGYHESIHFNPQSSGSPNYPPTVPAATAGYGQIFTVTDTDGTGTDTQLYWLSGGGKLAALTRNFQPVATTNGRTFLPGGFILQWGITASSAFDLSIAFPLTFPSSAYNVQLTPIRASGGKFTTNFSVTGLGPGGFTIVNGDGGATSLSFYWQAIGI